MYHLTMVSAGIYWWNLGFTNLRASTVTYITDCLYYTVDSHIAIWGRHFGWNIYILHICAESIAYAEVFWGFYELIFFHVMLDESSTVF